MKVNALLLALFAASANAQDVADPCKAKMDSVNTCLGIDAVDVINNRPNACKDCITEKVEAGMGGSDTVPDRADVDFSKLVADAVTSCEEEQTTCQMCKTHIDAFVACQAAIMAQTDEEPPVDQEM